MIEISISKDGDYGGSGKSFPFRKRGNRNTS